MPQPFPSRLSSGLQVVAHRTQRRTEPGPGRALREIHHVAARSRRRTDQRCRCAEVAEPAIWIGAQRILVHRGFERSEEHTSELQSLMRISYAVFCLKKKNR